MSKFDKIYNEYHTKIREEVVYVHDGQIDPESDADVDEEPLFDQVDTLEKNSPISILRGKDLFAIYLDNGKAVAAAYNEVDGDEFSFDIIVADSHQGKGIGSKMIDLALEEFEMHKDANDEIQIRVDVVNPVMKKALEKRGFDVKEETGKDRWIMGVKDEDEEGEEFSGLF